CAAPALHSFPTRRSSDLPRLTARDTLHFPRGPEGFAVVAPDGRHLAVGGADRVVRLWQLADVVASRGLPAPGGAVYGAAVSPDRSEEHTSELQSRGHLVC